MLKKIILLFLFLTTTFSSIQAQFIDTIQYSLTQKKRFTFKIDTKNSFITKRRAEIVGLKLGVDYNKKFRIGVGVHSLKSAIFSNYYLMKESGEVDTASRQFKVEYIAAYAEYVFYKTRKWEFSIPVQIGIGNSRYQYVLDDNKIEANKRLIIIYEPVMSGQYRFFPWLGVGADFGYRVMLKNNHAINEKLTSPVYGFKILIFYGELFKAVFPNSKLPEKLKKI